MKIDGWYYYNHAAIPTTAPHENPDISPIKDGNIWKIGGGVLLYWQGGLLTMIAATKRIGGT